MAELLPRLAKGDFVRIVGVFNTGDVTGIVEDDYQSVIDDGDELSAALRHVYVDGEDIWPSLGIKKGSGVMVHSIELLVKESDLFLVEHESDA